MKIEICTWCGAEVCDPSDAFHDLLRRHDLHTPCWSGVPDAWLPLLDRLCTDLKAMGWNGRVGQIKEKFGTLRFYAEDTDDRMDARIREAEREADGPPPVNQTIEGMRRRQRDTLDFPGGCESNSPSGQLEEK